jgi:hypothetical protein
MRALDDDGRVLGRINIIDTAVLCVVCLLIPLAYGAYLLFRTPPARITAIEPSRGREGLSQITIRGEHLRPYLRMGIGKLEAPLLFENAARATLALPPLTPGAYDIVLFDESQELQRLPGALVIEAPPVVPLPPPARVLGAEVIVDGAFRGLEWQEATRLAEKLKRDNDWGRIIALQPAEKWMTSLQQGGIVVDRGYQIRALIRLRCVIDQELCKFGTAVVTPTATLALPLGGQDTLFAVDEAHSVFTRQLRLTLHLVVPPSLTEFLIRNLQEGRKLESAWERLRPSLISIRRDTRTPTGDDSSTAVLAVPAAPSPEGWMYRGRILRVGEEFSFQGETYQLKGAITNIMPGPDL